MKETTIVFGKERSLVGIVTQPDGIQASPIAVILLNAGLIPRVGPNRLYVRLARHLAQMGLLVLRFDLSGVGDSGTRTDKMPFEQAIVDDTRQAMDELARSYGVNNFIFMGHCSGAAQSFLMGLQEDRVKGVVLLNPQANRQDWQEYDRKRKVQQHYQNYYGKQVLIDKKRWRKFLTGKADYRSIFRNIFKDVLWSKLTTGIFRTRSKIQGYSTKPDIVQQRVIDGLQTLGSRQIPLLFIYSFGNTGFELLQVMLGKQFDTLIHSSQVQLETIEGADHTFTLRNSQDRVLELIGNWCAPHVEPVVTPEH